MPNSIAGMNTRADYNFDANSGVKGGGKMLSKDDFLKLLMKQMLMQDPMKPFDSAQMMDQMATLTSLTSSEDLQKTIQGLGVNIARSQAISASQLIGKKVQIANNVSPLMGNEGLSGSVILPAPSSKVSITITDQSGKVIKTITKNSSSSGLVDFDWDGKDEDGKMMPDDFYKISAKALINGEEHELMTCGTFKIGSVAMNPSTNAVILNVDGLGGIDMSEVIKIL